MKQGYPPAQLIMEECVARDIFPSSLGGAWAIAQDFRPLSIEVANAISDRLGEPRINPQLWLNLDKAWQESRKSKGD